MKPGGGKVHVYELPVAGQPSGWAGNPFIRNIYKKPIGADFLSAVFKKRVSYKWGGGYHVTWLAVSLWGMKGFRFRDWRSEMKLSNMIVLHKHFLFYWFSADFKLCSTQQNSSIVVGDTFIRAMGGVSTRAECIRTVPHF